MIFQNISRAQTENLGRKKKGKREYLSNRQTNVLVKSLNSFFELPVDIPRLRIGKKQRIETLINEEVLLFAEYLRNIKQTWIPRIVIP